MPGPGHVLGGGYPARPQFRQPWLIRTLAGFAPIAVYTSRQGDGLGDGSAITTGQEPLAGDVLIVCTADSQVATPPTAPGGWTQITIPDTDQGTNFATHVYRLTNPAVNTTYTWTVVGGRRSIVGVLMRGMDTVQYLDEADSLETGAATTHLMPTVVTSGNSRKLLAFAVQRGFPTDQWVENAAAGWTDLAERVSETEIADATTNMFVSAQIRDAPTVGSYADTFTTTGSDPAIIVVLALIPFGGVTQIVPRTIRPARRPLPGSTRRGQVFDLPLVSAPASPAFPPPQLHPARRPGPVPVRRGTVHDVPPPPAAAAPAYIPAPLAPARRPRAVSRGAGTYLSGPPATTDTPPAVLNATGRPVLLARRGRYFPVPFQATATPPPLIPDRVNAHRPRLLPPRRGRYQAVPDSTSGTDAPAAVAAGRRRLLLQRRGQFFDLPPAPVVAAPPFVVAYLHAPSRVRPTVRRGQLFGVPPAPVVAAAPPFIPPILHAGPRPRVLPRRQGDFLPVPPPTTPATPGWVPDRIAAHRPKTAPTRRARTTPPPPAQTGPPGYLRRRRPLLPPARHGRVLVAFTAAIIPPPPRAPDRVVRRRRFQLPVRCGMSWTPPFEIVEAHSCDTPRPSSGITSRPSSGTTAYALAVTARPGSGITTRPFTGVTEDPC